MPEVGIPDFLRASDVAPPPFLGPQSRYDEKNNAIVTVPPDYGSGAVTRESRENIGGQVGTSTYGTTDVSPVLDFLGAPGGLAQLSDIPTIAGELEQSAANLLFGLAPQQIRKEVAKKPATIQAQIGVAKAVRDDLIDAVAFVTTGDLNSALGSFIKAFSEPGKVQAGGPLGALNVLGNAMRVNPAASESLASSFDNIRKSNEDFLIRHNLMHGPDDERTVAGNLISALPDTFIGMGGAILLKSPNVAALTLGVLAKERGTREAIEAGKEPAEAEIIGIAQGIPEALFNRIEFAWLVKKIDGTAKNIAMKFMSGLTGEAVEEAFTEAVQAEIQQATGLIDLTAEEFVSLILQAGFYGGLAGGITSSGIGVIQKLANISPETLEDLQSEMEAELAKDIESDVATESQIRSDSVSDAPVTKAAKNQAENEAKVAQLIKAFNDPEADFQAVVDEVLPEQRIAREKRLISDRQLAEDERTVRRTITARSRLLQQDLQGELAEQQRLATEFDTAFAAEKATKAIENRIDKNQERIDTIQEELQSLEATALEADVVTPGIVEELEGKGIIQRAGEVFQAATRSFDAAIRSFDAGVRAGTQATKAQTRALQDNITEIINTLPVDDKTKARLLKKVPKVNTVKNAQTIRNQIIAQGRTKALAQFTTDTINDVKKTISDNVLNKSERAKLSTDFQNSVDALQKSEATLKDKGLFAAINDLVNSAGGGIPDAGIELQMRYLNILHKRSIKTKVGRITAQEIAEFFDDLNAFIDTGKGEARIADAFRNAEFEASKQNVLDSVVTASRSEIEDDWKIRADETYRFFGQTTRTVLKVAGLENTDFLFFDEEVDYRDRRAEANDAMLALSDEVSDGDGNSYRQSLRKSNGNAIDVPRQGMTNIISTSSTNIKMTRGQMIYSWMLLQNASVREQMMDPKGAMGWTEEFIGLIESKMTAQDYNFAMGMFDLYEKSYAEFNEVYREQNNRDLPQVEFYSHITREQDPDFETSEYQNSQFYSMLADPSQAGLSELSQTKERVKNASSEIIIDDVLNSWSKYNVDVQHYISNAPKLELVTRLLNDRAVKESLQKRMGKAGYNTFLEHMKRQARRNIVHNKWHKLYAKPVEFLRKNAFSAALSLNGKIGIGQMSSVFAFLDGMPKGVGSAGIADYNINGVAADKILNQHSTFARRGQHFDPAIDQLGKGGRFVEMSRWAVRKGDAWAVKSGAWARYKWLTETKGVDPDTALNQVAELAERSQQSTLNTEKTLAQKSDDPVVRAMVMWRSSLTAMWNVSVQSIADYQQTDTSTPAKKFEARKKLFETLAIQQIVIPAAFNVATGSSRSALLLGSSAAIPIMGDLLEFIMANILNVFAEEDEKIFIDGAINIPASDAMEEALQNITGFAKDPSIDTTIDVIATAAEIAKGIPANNILNAGEGVVQIVGGENVTDGVLKVLGFKKTSRETMLKRLEAATGANLTARKQQRRIATGL